MNIFEEIAESYTYNGVVSLKALEDDIVTLENQIDSYNSTLNELRLRGKKSSTLIEKIRDAKMRLSLLKAVLKKEKDKASPDDIIKNMLGISAKNANETEMPGTAADKKEPVLQNFEKAEAETTASDKENASVEVENIPENDIVVEGVKDDSLNVPNDILNEASQINDTVSVSGGKNVEESEVEVVIENTIAVKDCPSIVSHDDVETNPAFDVAMAERLNDDGRNIIQTEQNQNDLKDYDVPVNEENCETDKKSAELEKYKVAEDTYDLKDASVEELNEFFPLLNADDTVFVTKDDEVIKNETEIPNNDCPSPTMDDYFEPVNDAEATDYSDDKMAECELIGGEKEEPNSDFDTYQAFYNNRLEIASSIDLCGVTDMVNTMYVCGNIEYEKNLLFIRFPDIRDYDVFIKLVNDFEDARYNPLKMIGKKRGSIFMYVTVKTYDSIKKYKFEFTKCRLKNVVESEHHGPADFHMCEATFKYKKLIITS